MPGRLGPRFAIEAVFLILLAVGAGLADLTTREIALVMGLGWLLVALLELATERLHAAAPPFTRAYYATRPPVRAAEPPAGAEAADAREVDEATVIVSAPVRERAGEPADAPPVPTPAPAPPEPAVAVAAAPVLAADSPSAGAPVSSAQTHGSADEVVPREADPPPQRYRLEPLQPRPKRRWFGRGERTDPSSEPAPEPAPERVAQPKHVRLLPGRRERGAAADEVAEIFDDVAESDERGRR